MILSLENISKSYGKGKKVLDAFSMDFSSGIYGLLGPNGAGKSTLMNIITDNMKPDQGKILYNGKEIHNLNDKYRNVLGYMPQQQSLYDNFTGEEFLWYMAALKGMSRKKSKGVIRELLGTVNLVSEKDKKIGSYSGGMKQRILIAQAMLNNPEILIMDEPTAGLDPSERIRIRNLLSTISEHKIIIVATHLVSDIEFIAKEVILLKKGKVVKSGTPQALLEELDGKVYEVEIGINETYQNENAKIANIRMGIKGKIYRVIQDERPHYENVRLLKPSLEDIYLYYLSQDEKYNGAVISMF